MPYSPPSGWIENRPQDNEDEPLFIRFHTDPDCPRIATRAAFAKALKLVVLDNLRLPFGFEPEVWTRIVADTDRLRTALEGDEIGDDEIEEQAAEYRTLLRQYV